eukprot:jgi/Bigna1/79277/fgenesh1_pg.61_\
MSFKVFKALAAVEAFPKRKKYRVLNYLEENGTIAWDANDRILLKEAGFILRVHKTSGHRHFYLHQSRIPLTLAVLAKLRNFHVDLDKGGNELPWENSSNRRKRRPLSLDLDSLYDTNLRGTDTKLALIEMGLGDLTAEIVGVDGEGGLKADDSWATRLADRNRNIDHSAPIVSNIDEDSESKDTHKQIKKDLSHVEDEKDEPSLVEDKRPNDPNYLGLRKSCANEEGNYKDGSEKSKKRSLFCSGKAKIFYGMLGLIVFTTIATILLILTLARRHEDSQYGTGPDMAAPFAVFYIIETALFVLYLQRVEPQTVNRENIRTWCCILFFMGITIFMTDLRALRQNFFVRSFVSLFYMTSNMTGLFFYPLYKLKERDKDLSWFELLSVREYPVLCLLYAPLMFLTALQMLAFAHSRSLFLLLEFVWVMWSVFSYFIILPSMRTCLQHDEIGYILYVGLAAYNPRVSGSLYAFLSRLVKGIQFKHVGLFLILKIVFPLGAYATQCHLDVLKNIYKRERLHSLIFSWQFAEDFIVSSLYADSKLNLEFAIMLFLTSSSNYVRDSGFLHEYFNNNFSDAETPSELLKLFKADVVTLKQNTVSETAASPLILVVVVVQYFCSQWGSRLLPLERNAIINTLYVFSVLIPTTYITRFFATRSLTDRLTRLEVNAEVELQAIARLSKGLAFTGRKPITSSGQLSMNTVKNSSQNNSEMSAAISLRPHPPPRRGNAVIAKKGDDRKIDHDEIRRTSVKHIRDEARDNWKNHGVIYWCTMASVILSIRIYAVVAS